MRRLLLPLAFALLLGFPGWATPPWRGETVAFFGVAFIDHSTEGDIRGQRADQTARTSLVADYIAEVLAAEGMEVVDLAPVADELERTRNPGRCNGCELRMARQLGARFAVVAEVNKVSNLILSVSIAVREAETGAHVAGSTVDIRGNTDESWLHGARYILTRHIFVWDGGE